jgi:hypothetical protein
MAPNAQDSFTTDADDVEVVLNANAQDSEMQTTCVRWLGDEKQEHEDEQEDPVSASRIRPIIMTLSLTDCRCPCLLTACDTPWKIWGL